MLQTVEAILQPSGTLQLLEPVVLTSPRRVLVTFTEPDERLTDALLSEAALAQDWLREEEDAAWAHLQRAK